MKNAIKSSQTIFLMISRISKFSFNAINEMNPFLLHLLSLKLTLAKGLTSWVQVSAFYIHVSKKKYLRFFLIQATYFFWQLRMLKQQAIVVRLLLAVLALKLELESFQSFLWQLRYLPKELDLESEKEQMWAMSALHEEKELSSNEWLWIVERGKYDR